MKLFEVQYPFLVVIILVLLIFTSQHSYSSHEFHITNTIRCLERERLALLHIKSQLVDARGQLSSWGKDEDQRDDCCEWSGIHCHNRTNHVTQLRLNLLSGKISTSLQELQHLRYLDVSGNNFEYAPIPEFIGSLTKLHYLNLAQANFSGPIPRQIGNLSKLLSLDISFNDNCYSENLDWLFSLGSLEHLDLSYTKLSKATNWIQAVSKLTSIKELHLYHVSLPEIPLSLLPKINGSSPLARLDLSYNPYPSMMTLFCWFSNFSTILTSIYLEYNSMVGSIPNDFENMMSLEDLSLKGNHLKSGIPKYFGNLSSLTSLDISDNYLSGDICKVMMNLSAGPLEKKLEYLDLSLNDLSGSFPNISNFSSLTKLYVQRNHSSGSIREGYLRLPHLVSLDLSSNRITGPIPDLSLFSSSLEALYLSNNMFNGTLTESIGRLSRLRHLDLSFNSFLEVQFSPSWVPRFQLATLSLTQCKLGKYFPKWLETQKELRWIDISSTGISDIIPSWFGRIPNNTFNYYMNASDNQIYGLFPNFSMSLDRELGEIILYISRNMISGSLNFLCDVKEWMVLQLSDNLFSGQIPDCFANFQKLTVLNLANNHFSGEIPNSFGQLNDLTLLHLSNNSLSGGIPTTMRICRGLKMIDVGGNRLTGNIPSWIGDSFPYLIVLVLRSNEFYGDIPSNICRLSNLQILDISSNKNISGAIPQCLPDYVAMSTEHSSDSWDFFFPIHTFMIPPGGTFDSSESAYFMWKGKELKYTNHLIDFSNNNLVGEIPSNITKLVGLVTFNISNNNLVGPIPPLIGEMKSLDSLDFSRNHLSGGIPTSICDLDSLGHLNLSYNNLSGRIPQDSHCLTFEGPTYIGNVGLCGPPLNKSCLRDEPIQDPYSTVDAEGEFEDDDDDDDKFITRGFYIALALGFIIGFWGIYGTIMLNKTFGYAVFNKFHTIWDFVCLRIELSKARFGRYFQNR